MIPLISFNDIEKEIERKYRGQEKLIGIMLANYNVDFVKGIISQCYSSWDIEAGSSFDIFWPGYGYCNWSYDKPSENAKKIPPLVNFNAELSIDETKRLIEEDKEAIRHNLREDVSPIHYGRIDISERFENHNRTRFYEAEYIDAKRYIRSALNLTRYQKVDSMTLLLLNYTGESVQFDQDNSIILTLTELHNSQLPVVSVNDLVSELNAYCVDENSFSDVKRAAKPLLKKGSDWKTNFSLFLSTLETIGTVAQLFTKS